MKEKQTYLYKTTNDIDAVDYYQEYRITGEIIEIFQQYKKDKLVITPAPSQKETVDKILALLKKTGIKKITIIR